MKGLMRKLMFVGIFASFGILIIMSENTLRTAEKQEVIVERNATAGIVTLANIQRNIATVQAAEVNIVAEPEPEEPTYEFCENELYLLSHLIEGEAGSDTCSDELQRYVASVAINRYYHEAYPNDLEEVIFQPGQYRSTWDGNFDKAPSRRAIDNAYFVLVNGSQLPSDVVYQAEFVQGSGVYTKEQNMLFCYR